MCARTVRMQWKPNSVAKFNQTLANDILITTGRPDEEKGGEHDGGRHAEYSEA